MLFQQYYRKAIFVATKRHSFSEGNIYNLDSLKL